MDPATHTVPERHVEKVLSEFASKSIFPDTNIKESLDAFLKDHCESTPVHKVQLKEQLVF